MEKMASPSQNKYDMIIEINDFSIENDMNSKTI